MDHADLRTVTVGDRQLIICLHQVCQSLGGYFYRIPLLGSGIAQGVMSQRYDNSFLLIRLPLYMYFPKNFFVKRCYQYNIFSPGCIAISIQ